MAHSNDKKRDPLTPTAVTNDPREQETTPKTPKEEVGPDSTRLPGTTQRDTPTRPIANDERNKETTDPNPGPGITSQGQRIDEDTPARGNERDPGRSGAIGKRHEPLEQDKDREETTKEHKVGDDRPEHTTRAND